MIDLLTPPLTPADGPGPGSSPFDFTSALGEKKKKKSSLERHLLESTEKERKKKKTDWVTFFF